VNSGTARTFFVDARHDHLAYHVPGVMDHDVPNTEGEEPPVEAGQG
jgi:hypothetical protein